VEIGPPFDEIEVDLEHASLAQRVVEKEGERQLLQLAAEALLSREEEVLGELLRDRRGPRTGVSRASWWRGRRELTQVEALMAVVAGVFGQERVRVNSAGTSSRAMKSGDSGEIRMLRRGPRTGCTWWTKARRDARGPDRSAWGRKRIDCSTWKERGRGRDR